MSAHKEQGNVEFVFRESMALDKRDPQIKVSTCPLLPLREMVVFPYMIIPLFVGRDKSLASVEKALEGSRSLVVVSQKDVGLDDPGVDDLYTVGTVVSIMQMVKLPDGIVKILVEGGHRARVDELEYDEKRRLLHGHCHRNS